MSTQSRYRSIERKPYGMLRMSPVAAHGESWAYLMTPATGSLNAIETGGCAIRPPTDAESFPAAARGMVEGAQISGAAYPIPAAALTHLCGHAAEACPMHQGNPCDR
jgi:hypothetical protein